MTEIEVVIGELPSEEEMETKTGSVEQTSNKALGIKVKELSPEQIERRQLENGGVVVYETGPGAGRSAGIRRGDVIQMIGGKKISNVKEFKEVVGGLKPGKSVAVLVLRRVGPVFLALKVPEK
jgi:serine protease Do